MTTTLNAPPTTATDDLLRPMPTRALGRMGWNASSLTLGGVKWDTQIPEAEAIQLIHRALELGINTFDTAHGYGNGQSETRLGLALRSAALQRDRIWVNTKTAARSYDEAKRQIETSLQRLQLDYVDLLFVHGLDNDADYDSVMRQGSCLKAIEEYRSAGQVRHIGVSGHHYKHNMQRIVRGYPFDAILCPVGLFNLAYGYSYFDGVIPAARERGCAVLGMKVFGAGRVKHAADIEPYLRYSLNQPIDTAVIGCDSIEQLEQTVRIVKRQPPALSEEQIRSLLPESKQVTQSWDKGEFNWVAHYVTTQAGT